MTLRSPGSRFEIQAIAAALPGQARRLLVDTGLTGREAAVARIGRPTPHLHRGSDQ